jgi:hypothetical protein
MKILPTAVVVSLVALSIFAGIVARGWEATPTTLTSRADALSTCVRSTAKGEISLLKFPDCITLTFNSVERQELRVSATHKALQLEESFHALEETRDGFEKYMEPQASREEPDNN